MATPRPRKSMQVEPDTIPETYSRFPRTMGEAFKDARYSDPIERHPGTGYPPLWWACMGVITVAALTLAWVTR